MLLYNLLMICYLLKHLCLAQSDLLFVTEVQSLADSFEAHLAY